MFGTPNYHFGYSGINSGYPYSQNYNAVQQQQPSNSGLNWVQGEVGAKSYYVPAGQSVLLMDSESNVFYIKSTDASGMPMPLRIFDYTERAVAKNATTEAPHGDYVTREEFDKVIAELKDAKRSIPAV